jgi:hypothetical protein
MNGTPLRDGVRQLARAARREEWTFDRVLTADERERTGTEGAEEVKDLLVRTNAGRRLATSMLRDVAAGGSIDDWPAVEPGPARTWEQAHHEGQEALCALMAALDVASGEQLASDPGPRRSHPQYLWRHVAIYSAREPFLAYAAWHHRSGRTFEALAVLGRWYDAVREAGLPTKALSDASYDLACGLARAGRGDDAMRYLPDAFSYNDRAAIGVLKAWARQDPDLQPLSDRADFRALVGAS